MPGEDWEPGSLLLSPLPSPAGWHRLRHHRELPVDRFEDAAEALLTWQVQRRAGFSVRTEQPRLAVGARARLGLGPLRAPVEVVALCQEADRVGFAYVALPGHPERGEEAFWVERQGARLLAVVQALSRPAHWPLRLAGPVGRRLQAVMAERYLDVLAGR